MKSFLKNIIFLILFTINPALHAADIIFNELPSNEVANFLGWVPIENSANLCKGYYKEPSIVLDYPTPPPAKITPVTITAKKKVFYSAKGDSILHFAKITQPGREITADKIILHRDAKTGKITNADLFGHVHLREFGKLVIGNKGHVDFKNHWIRIDNSIYRLSSGALTGNVNVWGRARKIIRDQSKVLTLYHSSYSTCQPDSNTWYITSSKLKLNKTSGQGTVTNAFLFFKHVPIFYFPYFIFPIDNRRKTGFLYPNFEYSSRSGFGFSMPLYLNLAPNYDTTLTPRFLSTRGVLMNGLFRYLTTKNEGELGLSYIYHDREFSKFKNSAKLNFPNDPALPDLEDSSNNRSFFSFQNKTKLNDSWSGNVILNYVTDDYFFRDFGNAPSSINNNQLLNRGDLNYKGEHWNFLGRLQAFQTLHMMGQESEDQYQRLPQLDLSGDYPNQKFGLGYHLNSEVVYFDRDKDFYTGEKYPIGGRINIQPSINLPLNWSGIYINPKLELPLTYYALQNQNPGDSENISRVLPITSIDSEMVFNRDISIFGNKYTQNLVPRVFYLFVPIHNQDEIPLFDSELSEFSFDNLFRTNRFNGIDRIGDANQLSTALTSSLLNANTGEEKLRLSVGEMFAFHTHKVFGDETNTHLDPLADNHISPLIGELQYNLSQNWNIIGDSAWDFHKKRINNAGATFQYIPNADHIINASYNFIAEGDYFNGQQVNLNRIDISSAWLIGKRWRLLGDWNYNISNRNSQAYFYGVEYHSCCWAIRTIISRIYTGLDGNKKSTYSNYYYVQFMFTSLGSVGASGAGSLLTSRIPGFSDSFARGHI